MINYGYTFLTKNSYKIFKNYWLLQTIYTTKHIHSSNFSVFVMVSPITHTYTRNNVGFSVLQKDTWTKFRLMNHELNRRPSNCQE